MSSSLKGRSEFRIGADGADLEELFQTVLASASIRCRPMAALAKKTAGVIANWRDPAHLGGEVHHDGGADDRRKAARLRLPRQVILAAAGTTMSL